MRPLLEAYAAVAGPYAGSSCNWYDPGDDRWHQVWVDKGGTRLNLAGGLVDGGGTWTTLFDGLYRKVAE